MNETAGEDTHRLLLLSDEDCMFRPALKELKSVEVHYVHSPYRAVRDFCAEPTDLVVTNLQSFHESGVECISIFRDLAENAFILATYSRGDHEMSLEALTHGADAVLGQPFHPRELTALLGRGLSRVRAAGRGAETADRAGEIAILVNELASAAEDTNQALQNALQAMHGTGREGGAAGESIRREAETQKLIAEQLRTYSSASPENVESVEINALADRILRETMQAAGGVNVQKNLDALPSTIEAEPQLLEQAWRYVLRRSLAAMTAGGTLVVETERTNQKEVVLSVWHTAHSLNEQAQRPGESPAAGPDGGKRWALAYPIAHRIARLHGGDFSVSRHDDRGTRAVFTFPVAPDNAEQ